MRLPELLPLASRLRLRLSMEPASPEELVECLRHGLERAGNPKLMTTELCVALAEHAQGNYRVLMTMANDLLMAAAERELRQIDEKLFFDLIAAAEKPRRAAKAR